MNKLKIKIGNYRNANTAEVPWLSEKHEMNDFVSSLSISEIIDLACILEFHFFNASRDDPESQTFDEYANLCKVFSGRLQESHFLVELENLNLRTSIDRVNLGRRLAER